MTSQTPDTFPSPANGGSTPIKHNEYKVSLGGTPGCWTFVASSSPYCVFRNPSRYVHNNHDNYQLNSLHPDRRHWDNEAKRRAFEQTVFFLDSVIEQPIPTHLLTDTIYDDIQTRRLSPAYAHRRNTLLSFEHGSISLLLHCAGECMDELVLRNSYFLQPQYEWKQQPGFTINIGKGSPIMQMGVVGKSQFGLSSNILVRTRGEIFHLKTFDVSDLADGAKCSLGHTLEPKGKWHIPNDEIVDMTTSKSDWSYAFLASKEGSLYEWNPTTGIKNSMNFLSSPLISSDSAVSNQVPPYMIEARAHPKLLYMAHGHQVFNIDTRSRKISKIFSNLDFADSSDFNNSMGRMKQPKYNSPSPMPIQGIRCNDYADHMYFLSTDRAVMLMDSRYPKTHVFKQSTYETHNQLLYTRINALNKANSSSDHLDILLSTSSSASQIYSHCFRSAVPPRSSAILADQRSSLSSDVHPFDLLKSASSTGIQSSVRWQTEGFPVVDKTESCTGLELVILPRLRSDAPQLVGIPDYCALLVQQSNIGDVFVQRLTLERPYKLEKEIESQISRLDSTDTMSVDSEDPFQTQSSSKRPPNDKQTYRGKTSVKYPPVQTNLAISNRSFVSNISKLSYSHAMNFLSIAKKNIPVADCGQLTRAFAAIQRYFYGKDKVYKFRGLSLDPALSKEIDLNPEVFAAPSKAFRKFIPEDSLMGRDNLLFIPSDVRRDLPALPSAPHLLAVNAAPPRVSSLEEAEAVFRKHHKEISQAIEKSPKSLWEIWKLLCVVSTHRVDIGLIRQLLLCQAKYEETWWICRTDQSSRILSSFYSDGLYVKIPTRKHKNQTQKKPSQSRSRCKCSEDVQKWSLGVSGGRLNNQHWILSCKNKFCILPYRLIYSCVGDIRESIFSSTPHQGQQGRSNRQRNRERTDLTADLCDALNEAWDMSLDHVYCAWPSCHGKRDTGI